MKKVLLSFDVEEFDLPREHGAKISLEEGLKVSSRGLERILDTLAGEKVKATFFITGNFAEGRPDLVLRIRDEGHEVACHGVDHFKPEKKDVENSKKIVEKVAEVKVLGWRQPRMGKIDYGALERCGYLYDTSVNPAFIPGRYNNTKVPRRPFMKKGIVEIPTSVTGMRVPLFWLALHLFPAGFYIRSAKATLEKTGYFATYFHPWEFADELKDYRAVPGYIKYNSGVKLKKRLHGLIRELKMAGGEFVTYAEFAEEWKRRELNED